MILINYLALHCPFALSSAIVINTATSEIFVQKTPEPGFEPWAAGPGYAAKFVVVYDYKLASSFMPTRAVASEKLSNEDYGVLLCFIANSPSLNWTLVKKLVFTYRAKFSCLKTNQPAFQKTETMTAD